ncbi:MAG: PTS system mannose/fructose/sorbose family transporter subunit IID [Anaerolineae bacterium]
MPTAQVDVTWQAAMLIALCYYLSQSAWLAGVGFWTLYRPLVGGALVGLILGDPWAGAQAGAAINLAYIGFVAAGGALPSDISLAGYLGTTLVLAGGLDVNTALALTVPVGALGLLIYQLRLTISVAFVHWADWFAARGNAGAVALLNVLPAQLLLLLLSAVPCFVGVYYGPTLLAGWLAGLPAWVLPALTLAGGLLPALGIAMSLNLLWHGRNPLFFVAGFAAAALLDLPALALGLIAVAVAAWIQLRRFRSEAAPSEEPVAQSVGRTPLPTGRPALLRRSDLFTSWLTWLFFSHANYNYERFEGTGFAHSMVPVFRRLYTTPGEMAEALRRHMVYYNSEPNVGAFTNGLVVALEEQRALGLDVGTDAIHATKAGLMGPLAGVGDSLIQGAVAPMLLSLGVALASDGNLLGPLIYVVAIVGVIWGVGWGLFLQGYRAGSVQLAHLARRGTLQRIMGGAEIVGSVVLGGLAARYVQVPSAWVVLDGEAWSPGWLLARVLPLALVLGYLALVRRRVPSIWLVLATFLVGIAAALGGLA